MIRNMWIKCTVNYVVCTVMLSAIISLMSFNAWMMDQRGFYGMPRIAKFDIPVANMQQVQPDEPLARKQEQLGLQLYSNKLDRNQDQPGPNKGAPYSHVIKQTLDRKDILHVPISSLCPQVQTLSSQISVQCLKVAELGDFGNFLHFWLFVRRPVLRPVRQLAN